MVKFSNNKNNSFKASFTFTGYFISIFIVYSGLAFANFIIELFFIYYYPGDFHSQTDLDPPETLIQAAEQAKDETLEFVTKRPIQLAVVSSILAIGVFLILYGPWEY